MLQRCSTAFQKVSAIQCGWPGDFILIKLGFKVSLQALRASNKYGGRELVTKVEFLSGRFEGPGVSGIGCTAQVSGLGILLQKFEFLYFSCPAGFNALRFGARLDETTPSWISDVI